MSHLTFGLSPLSVRVILLRPEQPRNIGAVVRAAANFGAESVRVVGVPGWSDEDEREARVASAGAWDVMGGVRLSDRLEEAAGDCRVLAGTSARPRRYMGAPVTPAAFFQQSDNAPGVIGVLFGPESKGLSTEDLSRCHVWLRIPTDPKFPSLNLAQAVLLVLYEAARARDYQGEISVRIEYPTAEVAAQEALLARWSETLQRRDSLSPAQFNRVMAQLRRLLNRAQPTSEDLAMLDNLRRAAGESAKPSGK